MRYRMQNYVSSFLAMAFLLTTSDVVAGRTKIRRDAKKEPIPSVSKPAICKMDSDALIREKNKLSIEKAAKRNQFSVEQRDTIGQFVECVHWFNSDIKNDKAGEAVRLYSAVMSLLTHNGKKISKDDLQNLTVDIKNFLDNQVFHL